MALQELWISLREIGREGIVTQRRRQANTVAVSQPPALTTNVYFTYGLAPRLPEGITVNAFDPGLMPGTGLAREYSAPLRWIWNFVMPKVLPLMRLLITENIHTPEASGAALARLITDPALASTNGKYFEGMREIRSSVDSYDASRAAELWESSAALTGIA